MPWIGERWLRPPCPRSRAGSAFANEFDSPGRPARATRSRSCAGSVGDRGAIADDEVLGASGVIHVASPTPAPVAEFRAEVTRLLGRPSSRAC